jgi:hypothetical protein
MVVLILCVGIITLVYGRKHYELFYNQGIHTVISEINKAQEQFGKDSVEAVIIVEDYFVDYYNKNFPLDKNSRYLALNKATDLGGLSKIAYESTKNYFVFGTVRGYPVESVQIVKEYFPYVISKYKGHLTEVFVHTKTPVDSAKNYEVIFSSDCDFTSKQDGWNFTEQKFRTGISSLSVFPSLPISDEFPGEFKTSLDELVKDKNDLLHVKVFASMKDTFASPLLVMSMESDGNTVDWRAAKFSDYLIWSTGSGESGNVYLSVRFSDIHIDSRNTTFKAYVWNKDHSEIRLSFMKVSSEKGNPYFYGLFEEF